MVNEKAERSPEMMFRQRPSDHRASNIVSKVAVNVPK